MNRSIHRKLIALLVLATAATAWTWPTISYSQDTSLADTLRKRKITLAKQEDVRAKIGAALEFGAITPAKFCMRPPVQTQVSDIDPHRSLFVHDRATLDSADFSLKKTLERLSLQATSAGAPVAGAEEVFKRLWDTQNPAPGVVAGAHCDDNGNTINGFPVSCRPEGQEAVRPDTDDAMKEYKPIALVNRLDLAHEKWRNCGEHRIIYGKVVRHEVNGQIEDHPFRRNFIIMEAVLPNPTPGCRSGCLPVAKFWSSLSDSTQFPTPQSRAIALEKFFYEGLSGFRPVVHVDHYSAKGVSNTYGSSGSGQIRTNQFIQGPNPPWMLKEFKTVIDCGALPCRFDIAPIMVKVNPFGELWSTTFGQPTGADFRADLLLNLDKLAASELTKIGYPVDLAHDAAESNSQNGLLKDDYIEALNVVNNTFKAQITTALANGGIGLSADQIAARAAANSCAGCHKPDILGLTQPNALGPVTLPDGSPSNVWPDALSFVHVDASATSRPELPGPLFGSNATDNSGHEISPALNNVFLPERAKFLVGELNAPVCACKRRFVKVDPNIRKRLRAIEDGVLTKFSPMMKKETSTLIRLQNDTTIMTAAVAEAAVGAQFKKLNALEIKRGSELTTKLKRAGAPMIVDSLKPQVLKLRAAALSGGDLSKEHELRTKEVLQIVRSEPARRTVTGSFRVH
jgi:hypothetical protein